MAESLHPAATHHLPSFITAPGDTDVLMVVMTIVLALAILMFGILFFRLHTLPERMAHKTQKLQFEIVAVLGLIALFTHMHIFWVAGLILALIEFPDFGTPLGRIARSVETMAGIKPSEDAAKMAEAREVDGKDPGAVAIARPVIAESRKELGHV
jgi:multisubunit Na+/H+ antiporter MnhF subunit